jgi:predicted permease
MSLLALLSIVLPVFALVALGALLRRLGVLSGPGCADINRLVYWVALPAQLVDTISRSDLAAHVEPRAVAAAAAAYLAALALAWVATASLGPAVRGSALNAAVRSNAAFIALPIALLLAERLAAPNRAALVANFLMLLALMVPLFNFGAVASFLLPQHGLTIQGLRRAGGHILVNPLVIACACGAACSLGASRAPPAALAAAHALGQLTSLLGAIAVPLALLAAGAQLDLGLLRRRWGLIAATTAAKLIAVPLLGWALACALGISAEARVAVVLILAAPTAVASVPMAQALGADAEVMAAMVVASTAAAPLTLMAWLALAAPGAGG